MLRFSSQWKRLGTVWVPDRGQINLFSSLSLLTESTGFKGLALLQPGRWPS